MKQVRGVRATGGKDGGARKDKSEKACTRKKKSVRNRVKDKRCSQEGRGGGKRGAIKTTRWGMSDHACTDVSVLQREMRGRRWKKFKFSLNATLTFYTPSIWAPLDTIVTLSFIFMQHSY